MCLLPVAFLCQPVLPAGIPIEEPWGNCKFILHAVQQRFPLLDCLRRLHTQKGKDDQSQNPGQEDDRQKKQSLVVLIVVFITGKEFTGIVDVVEIQIQGRRGRVLEIGSVPTLLALERITVGSVPVVVAHIPGWPFLHDRRFESGFGSWRCPVCAPSSYRGRVSHTAGPRQNTLRSGRQIPAPI